MVPSCFDYLFQDLRFESRDCQIRAVWMMVGMSSRWSGIYKPWLTRLSSCLRFPFHKVAATNIGNHSYRTSNTPGKPRQTKDDGGC